MGANLLIAAASLLLPLPQLDTTDHRQHPSSGIGYERLSDAVSYDRVQGLALGLGYRLVLPLAFTVTYATVRYGLSDERIGGRVSIGRELRQGYLRLSGYSDLADVDPMAAGHTISNTLNALFAGHDNGDYAWDRGASLTWETRVTKALSLELAASVEDRSSIARAARSAINDFLGGSGLFPRNPSIREGTFGFLSARLHRGGRNRWSLTLDGTVGPGPSVGRVFGTLQRSVLSRPGVTVRLKSGISTEPGLPQTLFRLGGINTVRGFEYGIRQAPAFWAAQADLTLLPGRFRPIVFVDVGQAAATRDLLSSQALVGIGAGLALLRGLFRCDLSHPLSPDQDGKLRFDLMLQ